MSTTNHRHRFHWLGSTAVAAIALAAVAVPLTPAKAQIGVEVGPFGVGIGAPYYGPSPYFHPYYHPYYGYYGPYYWGW